MENWPAKRGGGSSSEVRTATASGVGPAVSSELTNSHLLISDGRGRGRRSLHASRRRRRRRRGGPCHFHYTYFTQSSDGIALFSYNATLSLISKNASDKVPPLSAAFDSPGLFPRCKTAAQDTSHKCGVQRLKNKIRHTRTEKIKSLEFSAPGIHGESPARVRGHICHKIRGNRRRPPRVRPSPPGEGGFFAARHREVGRNLWSGPPARKFPGKKASPFFPDKNIFTAVETRDPKKRRRKTREHIHFLFSGGAKGENRKKEERKGFCVGGGQTDKEGGRHVAVRRKA